MRKPRPFPPGTTFDRWCVTDDRGKRVIRRWAHPPGLPSRYQRLPVEQFKHLDEQGKQDLCIRLNERDAREIKTRAAVAIRHAFISPELLDRYALQSREAAATKSLSGTEIYYLKQHALNYFVNLRGLMDPLQWKKHQHDLHMALINQDELRGPRLWPPGHLNSKKFIKDVINSLNHFLQWLHTDRPEEVAPIKLDQPPRALLELMETKREAQGQKLIHKYITEADWKVIVKRAPPDILPHLELGYYWGLRRAETFLLKPDDIWETHLVVSRQQGRIGQSLPTKNRKSREVPHWFKKADYCYKLVMAIKPRSLSYLHHRFADLMVELGMRYTLHDLRHTWCSRAARLKGNTILDVQHAAGHSDLNTTQKYLHKGEQTRAKRYVPPSAI